MVVFVSQPVVAVVQCANPVLHVGVQSPPVHDVLLAFCVPHVRLQPPQLVALVVVSAHVPPQQCGDPPVPPWYGPHRPLQHSSAAAQGYVTGLQQRPASQTLPSQHSTER